MTLELKMSIVHVRRVCRRYPVVSSFGIVWALAAWLGAPAASSAEATFHLGQKISDHVTARLAHVGLGPCSLEARRVLPNGATEGLVISNRWLVVTDVEWQGWETGFPILQAGNLLTLRIYVGEESRQYPVFESTSVVAELNVPVGRPILSKSEHLTAGFVLAAVPCFYIGRRGELIEELPAEGELVLHGYFIDRPVERLSRADDKR
jgi:hypothetical protein